MPTAQNKPRSLRACRNGADRPYPASARTQPKRTSAVRSRSISSIAISGLVGSFCGVPALRPWQAVPRHLSSSRAGTAASPPWPAPYETRASATPASGSSLICSASKRIAAPRRPSECPSCAAPCRRRSGRPRPRLALHRPDVPAPALGRCIPDACADEMMQLVVADDTVAQRHRLDALALTDRDQTRHVGRAHPDPRLMSERHQERRQPPFQLHSPIRSHRRFSVNRPPMNHRSDAGGISLKCSLPK